MSYLIITGASRGIGAAIARAFAKTKQHHLCLLGRDDSALKQVQAACTQLGSSADYFLCEMENNDSILQTADRILSLFGAPSIIVNNAGWYDAKPLLDSSPEYLAKTLQINCLAPANFTRAFLPSMIQQKRGDIFLMGSVASIQGYPDCGAYTMSKHALLGYARSLRLELKPHQIRVTCLQPGGVYTDSWSSTDIQPERLMTADDVANTIVAIQQLSPQTVVEEILLRPHLGDVDF